MPEPTSAYEADDEAVWEVLSLDPEAGGYDRRDDDEQPCIFPACGQPTTLRCHHQHWGPVAVCASCWDPAVHDPRPSPNAP